MRKRLLFFVTEDWFVCSHWLPHITTAREAGYEVHVVTRVRQHGCLIEKQGISVIPLELSRRGRNPCGELRIVAELIRIYRRIRPDLVFHIAMKPVVYGSIAASFSRPRAMINYVAGLGWIFTSRSIKARLLRWPVVVALGAMLKRGQVIVENPNDRALVRSLGLEESQITLVPGAGVDMRRFTPVAEPDDPPPLVVMASRMLWAKGVGEFVAAAEMLRAKGIRARFALVGMPDDENPSSVPVERLQAWRDSGVVEWWEHRSDMPEVFAQSHIVCLPTAYGEGVPKVLIEAAAAGRPIIATQIPGCREIVRDGESGILVPPGNAKALAEAIERLLNDQSLRVRMGQHGREIARERFSVENVTNKTLRLFSSLLA